MELEKWQALGNDYLIVELARMPFALTPARVRLLCHRNFGVGGDGVLALEPAREAGVVARLRIFNPDGSEAELSGNGAREAALYLYRRGWTDQRLFRVETAAGVVEPQILDQGRARIAIGAARLRSADFPTGAADGRGELEVDGRRLAFQHVNVGNPQCAIKVEGLDELAALDLAALGPPIEASPLFPNRTNVSFYSELEPNRIRARIFERGVGETLSSGTGAAGAAVAYALESGGPPRKVTVELDGGTLEVEVGEGLELHQLGWAKPVMRALLDPELLEELAGLQAGDDPTNERNDT